MTQKVLTQVDHDGNATVALNRARGAQRVRSRNGRAADQRAEEARGGSESARGGADGSGHELLARAPISSTCERALNSPKSRTARLPLASAQIFHTLYTLNKPTIARVHGAVRGGGVGLVAACDIAIGSRDTTFRLSEVRLGIVPAMISPYVVAAIGERHARRYFVSGEEFDSAEAFRIGLLHDLVELDVLECAHRPHAVATVLRRTACDRRR